MTHDHPQLSILDLYRGDMPWSDEDTDAMRALGSRFMRRAADHIEALEARVAALAEEHRLNGDRIISQGRRLEQLDRIRAVCAEVAGELRRRQPHVNVDLLEIAARLESATHPTPGDSK